MNVLEILTLLMVVFANYSLIVWSNSVIEEGALKREKGD